MFGWLSASLPLSVSRNPAENGFGPAPSGSADGDLSDGQLAALLPSLKQPDYYTEPSLQQVGPASRWAARLAAASSSRRLPRPASHLLASMNAAKPPHTAPRPTAPLPLCTLQLAAMARDDPGSLGAVANFSVGRRGVGSVRWLEPTDVRGLDLDATVQLSKGSIEVGGAVDLGC